MNTQTKAAALSLRYFSDQYGHIYRWEKTPDGLKSVSVANFQQHGSRVESERLIDLANSGANLLAALQKIINCDPHSVTKASDIARAAITKATGGQP